MKTFNREPNGAARRRFSIRGSAKTVFDLDEVDATEEPNGIEILGVIRPAPDVRPFVPGHAFAFENVASERAVQEAVDQIENEEWAPSSSRMQPISPTAQHKEEV